MPASNAFHGSGTSRTAKNSFRKFIREPSTRSFLTERGQWTLDRLAAREITDSAEAVAVFLELKVQKAELYYSFEDSCGSKAWDFAISLKRMSL